MEDNDLYAFFEAKQHTFDEAPGEQLWKRIEMGLAPAPLLTTRQVTLGIILTLIIAVVFFGIQLLSGKEVNILKDEKLVPAEDAKSFEINTIAVANDTVKKKKYNPKAENAVVAPVVMKYKKNTAQNQDTINTSVTGVKTANILPGRLIVKTDKMLSVSEFEDLIRKTFSNPELTVGTMVIVRAPGHKAFRQIFKGAGELHIINSGVKLEEELIQFKRLPDAAHADKIVPDTILIKPDSLTLKPSQIKFAPLPNP
ncbi:MAG: hypothetical protein EOO45_08035 [Flavobacterium sp.]|nr:MAG: hypothetical protein EOO45_08035 [Flavobacterium sp.]